MRSDRLEQAIKPPLIQELNVVKADSPQIIIRAIFNRYGQANSLISVLKKEMRFPNLNEKNFKLNIMNI